MDHKIYLTDPGIFKKGSKFYYHKSSRQVVEPEMLERLGKIYIPPAWKNVWYSSNKKCHVLAHGIDNNGKKQYVLSNDWINNSRYEKYNRMKTFMRDIKQFKRRIKLTEKFNYSKETLIKLLFNLMLDTHIRVGNEIYASTNGSYGLTTLRQRHLIGNYQFEFIGKSNKLHNITIPEYYNTFLKHYKLNNGNGPLFFYKENDLKKIINSDDLNDYLKRNMGKEYTCKDFRTYSANILFIKSFLKNSQNEKQSKKIILKSIDSTAQQLGHSRNISRKSYISNNLLDYCYDYFESASGMRPEVLATKVWE
jgi:DNA topoisomerase-1